MTDLGIQRSASGAALPAEILRQVAEEVRSAFPRPPSAQELVLIDVDPRRLHAFWTLSPAILEAARRELGPESDFAPMVLRVYQITPSGATAASFDVEVLGLQGQRYVDVVGEDRVYRGELGLLRSDGSIISLAVSAEAELPRLGPAGEDLDPRMPGVPERAREQAQPRPPSDPVGHPFPLPPIEPSDAGDIEASQKTAGGEMSDNAHERLGPVTPILQHPPGPVQHPFPLPPSEASEFGPKGMTHTVPQPREAGTEAAMPETAGDIPHADPQPRDETQPTQETHAPVSPAAEGASGSEGEPSGPLPLENVLTLSSYALGRETVVFEINAELHVFGRARPGTQLQLFGRKVPLRPDGTFLVIQPLPNGALVLSSLLVDDDARPLND
jgi:hypothetical protein